MKALLFVACIIIGSALLAQERKVLLQLDNIAVRNGAVYEKAACNKICHSGSDESITIEAKDEMVLSIGDGIVVSVVNLSGEIAVLVKTMEGFIVAYANCSEVSVAKGDIVCKGSSIGKIIKENGAYNLKLVMANEHGKMFTDKMIIAYLINPTDKAAITRLQEIKPDFVYRHYPVCDRRPVAH